MKQLQIVLDSYASAKIPLETIVSESNYMDSSQDFTISSTYEPFKVSPVSTDLWCDQ